MEDGTLGEDINPWGVALFRTLQGVELSSPDRGGGLRQVAGPDLDPRGGPPGPHPRRRRPDADAAVDRPVLHLGDRAGVPLRLRRQRRAGVGPGAVHGQRRRRSSSPCCCCSTSSTIRSTAASAASSRRDGTNRAAHRPAARGDRRRRDDPLRRRREPGVTARRRRRRRAAGAAGLGRDRRHRAAGARRRRHRVEQLPGQPVERRDRPRPPAGSTPCASTPPAPRASPRARPRSTSPCSSSGSTPPPTDDASSPTSTSSGSDPSSARRSTPGWPPTR